MNIKEKKCREKKWTICIQEFNKNQVILVSKVFFNSQKSFWDAIRTPGHFNWKHAKALAGSGFAYEGYASASGACLEHMRCNFLNVVLMRYFRSVHIFPSLLAADFNFAIRNSLQSYFPLLFFLDFFGHY